MKLLGMVLTTTLLALAVGACSATWLIMGTSHDCRVQLRQAFQHCP